MSFLCVEKDDSEGEEIILRWSKGKNVASFSLFGVCMNLVLGDGKGKLKYKKALTRK